MAVRSYKFAVQVPRDQSPQSVEARKALWNAHAFTNDAVGFYEDLLLELRQGDVCVGRTDDDVDQMLPADEMATRLRARFVARGAPVAALEAALPLLRSLYEEVVPSATNPNGGSTQQARGWHSPMVDPDSKGNATHPIALGLREHHLLPVATPYSVGRIEPKARGVLNDFERSAFQMAVEHVAGWETKGHHLHMEANMNQKHSGAAYVFGPWQVPDPKPGAFILAYRAAPMESERVEVGRHTPDDGGLPYYVAWIGATERPMEFPPAMGLQQAMDATDREIVKQGHYLAERNDPIKVEPVYLKSEVIHGLIWATTGMILAGIQHRVYVGTLALSVALSLPFLLVGMLGARRTSRTLSLTLSLSRPGAVYRWKGSRLLLWLNLLLLGRATNKHGQSVQFTSRAT